MATVGPLIAKKFSLKNCGQAAADKDMVTINNLKKVTTALSAGRSTNRRLLRFTTHPQYRMIG